MSWEPGSQRSTREGAGAGGVAVEPFCGPGVGFGGVGEGELAVDDDRGGDGEVGEGELGGVGEGDADRGGVDDFELVCGLHSPGPELRGGEAADGDGAVEGPFDVGGGDGAAVVEGGAGLELEGDGGAVGGDLPAFGELAVEGVVVEGGGAVGAGFGAEADQAVVGVDGDLVAGAVGAGAVDVEAVEGVADGDDDRVCGGGLGSEGAEERERCRTEDEGPPVHVCSWSRGV